MAEYQGTVELIGGLTPKNNGTFPLASAKDIQVDDTGKRLDEKLAELEQGGGTVTVTVDGAAGTASHSSTEIYALVQAGNTVVAVLPDYANHTYQYDKYNEPTAANAMHSTVEFIRTAVDENGIVTTDYIIIHDDKSADAGYYEGTGGADGITPHIGENGNWYIGTEDTGVKAQGEDGVGITSVDEMGGDATRTTHRMNFSDGSYYEFDVYHGTNGTNGTNGKSAYELWLAEGNTGSVDDFLASLKGADGTTQVTPLFANSIEECTDTTKVYVLPDGYIYAYMYTEVEVGGYTNVVGTSKDGFLTGYRMKAASAEPVTAGTADASTAFVSNAFSCKEGDILRIRGVGKSNTNSAVAPVFMVVPVDSSGAVVINHGFCLEEPLYNSTQTLFTTWKQAWNATEVAEDGTITWTYAMNNAGEQQAGMSLSEATTAVRLAGTALNGYENIIVTVNEEIVEPYVAMEYCWANTGHAFVPADYEERILDLEYDVSVIKKAGSFNGLLNYDIFDYAYIKNGELVANALNVTENQHGHYTGAKMDGNVKQIMCKAKLVSNASVVLISTKLGSTIVANIVRGSIHLIFNTTGCSVGIYDDGTTTLRTVATYSCAVSENTEVSFGYAVNESTNTLTVYLPDGTTKTVTDSAFSTVNGEYAIWEHFCNSAAAGFKCCRITKLWCESVDGDVLDDDLKRLDGAISVAPTGQPYRQFRTGQQTDRDFE